MRYLHSFCRLQDKLEETRRKLSEKDAQDISVTELQNTLDALLKEEAELKKKEAEIHKKEEVGFLQDIMSTYEHDQPSRSPMIMSTYSPKLLRFLFI